MIQYKKELSVSASVPRQEDKSTVASYPQRIYKFISFGADSELNKQKLSSLRNNQVYLSSPFDFNDPYDCQLSIDIKSNINEFLKPVLNREERRAAKHRKEIKSYITEESTILQTDLINEWNSFRKQMLVCCFTERWDSFLMWAHYANSYQGICIEYDMENMKKNKLLLCPVRYTEKLLEVTDYLRKDDIDNSDPKLFYKAGIFAVLSKHTSWEYEREWRLVDVNNSTTQRYQLRTTPTPSAIYIGPRISKDLKNEIVEISKKLKIPTLYDVVVSDTEYNLINQGIHKIN